MRERKSLSDILRGNGGFFDDWGRVTAADEYGPVPAGSYICRLTAADLFNAGTGTPGAKLVFRILEGDYADRRLFHDLWFTEAAKPATKRDLNKLGLTDPQRQLEQPVPPGIRCLVKVALRKDDDGTQRNKVWGFNVLGIDPPDVEPFAPQGDAAEPDGPADASFDPDRLDAEKREGGVA